jgi:uncharacterized membrane protein YphA (DoxX/SURF4 family)
MATTKNAYGKSFLLNIIFMVINLTGLVFLAMGYHEDLTDQALLFQILGFSFFIIGLAGISVFSGWIMFSYLARVLVGGLFIVSGLIKANDPLGFSYKLEEYFEDGALAYRVKDLLGWETFSLEFLIQYALELSIIICILEIVLGVLAIIGRKIRLTAWLMLGMMVFFTLLTWHTKECDPEATFRDVDVYSMNEPIAALKISAAEYNEDITILAQDEKTVKIAEIKKPQCVDDCGCFGDAMKGSLGRSLTPNESFWKDLVLLYLVVLIFISQRWIMPNTIRENLIMVSTSTLFIAFFSYVFGWGFPIFFGLTAILLALWILRSGGKLFGNDWGAIFMVTALCSLFTAYVLIYIPLKDYRPYHVGSDLRERMNDGIEGVYENILIYENIQTGELKTMTQDEFMASKIWEDKDTWKHKETITKTIVAARLPSITDQFNPKIDLESVTKVERKLDLVEEYLSSSLVPYIDVIDKTNGNRYPQLLEEFYAEDWDTVRYAFGDTIMRMDESVDELSLRDFILDSERIILVIARSLKDANLSRIQRLIDIHEKAEEHGIPMLMISTASSEDIQAFRETYGLEIPTLLNDETELKAITRSNPTLMVIEKGIVTGKFAFRSTPSWDWLNKNILNIE